MIVERFITARRATSRQQMFEPSKNVDVGPVSTHTHTTIKCFVQFKPVKYWKHDSSADDQQSNLS